MEETIDLTAGEKPRERSLVEIAQAIATDAASLVRKEVELAKREITEAAMARVKGAAALAAAGVVALLGVVFLGAAAAAALDLVVAPWASRLIVAGAFLMMAAAAGALGVARLKRPPLMPGETRRTVKEDVKWARAQLKR